MTAAEGTLGIGEASALTGPTTYALRFYEEEGLFSAPVRRDATGRVHPGGGGVAQGVYAAALVRNAAARDPPLCGAGAGGRR
jgi:hypothetical protein